MRFEQLGRRLVALAVTLLATVAGFGASRVAARRRRRRADFQPAPAAAPALPGAPLRKAMSAERRSIHSGFSATKRSASQA